MRDSLLTYYIAEDMSLECHIHKRGDSNIILRAPKIRYAISIATDNIAYAIAKFNLILRDLAGDILEQKGTLPTWHNGKDIDVTYIDHTREDFIRYAENNNI